MILNGSKYAYETNAQGDVTGLIDSSNNEVVTYAYDSWGKLRSIGGSLASTVGAENHMRYRGYYYDTETGLYYLQSRYYNPEIGRFISKDDPQYHTGMSGTDANLYAYAGNNPVNVEDGNGHFGTPVQIALNIGINLAVWAIWKYIVLRDYSWQTADTVDVITAVVVGIIGWWGSSYLRARASRFAWGVYIGVKSIFVSYVAHRGYVNKWWCNGIVNL